MSDSFVHLHVHTEYSMLDGAARLGPLLAKTAGLAMPAIAMTDHGNVYGAYDFYRRAAAAGVKPIIGMEAYLTPGTSRFDRTRVRWAEGGENDVSGGGAYTHLTLLAVDADGLRNLFRLASRASLEGFFYKPRIDRELLTTHAAGLVGTTGCPGGEVQTWLRIGDYAKARAAAADLRDIFGAGNFYLELMDHGLPIERGARADLLRLGADLGLPAVATNDLHYTDAADAAAHEVLLAVQSGKTLADPGRFKFDGTGFYLKSAEEMRALFDAEVPGACDTTLAIAERVGDYSAVFAPQDLMPRFPLPPGETEASWFVAEVERGLAARYPGGISAAARERADYEVAMILTMGFPGYFLVTADLIGWAKRHGIRVGPGRGSATGSLVAYAMRITELDPLEHSLLFERFLNPDRVSMPDIDIDFDERRRGEVLQYVTEKYGADKVCQVVTYGTIKTKQALKDASRVLGYPFAMGERITKALPPPVMAKDVPLEKIFDPTHDRYAEGGEFRALVESDPDTRRVFETAKGLEGLKRQWGVHACAVIMSSEPLLDHIPIMKREQDGAIITQFDYPTCEKLGLLKMDFLGLRNLTVIDDAVANVQANRGIELDMDALPLDDEATYRLLARGDTLGVFQLDGAPLRVLLRQMAPTSFADIAAVLALYRPGPMAANAHIEYAERKNGRRQVVPIHPELADALAEILDETYGLVVYQEQVQAIARKVAGYTLGQADLLRRAMGKKKKAELDAQLESFTTGMRANGFSQGAIDALWDTLLPFCDYGFNKSHTAGYGLVSYWTAYLKANYPAEYMAALLTSVRDDKDKMAVYLNECRHRGIKVLPPDVNESAHDFTPIGTDIRFGLGAVRNVGAHVVADIVGARAQQGAFADFADFMAKVPASACNKRVLESLIKAGAFDSMGYARRALLAVHEAAADQAVDRKRNEAMGQFDLFGSSAPDDFGGGFSGTVPDISDWDKQTRLGYEREMLGLYVSDHPLVGVEHVLARASDTTIGALLGDDSRPDGSVVTVGGLITAVTRKMTKRGDTWATITLEDLEGSVEVMVFPSTYQQVATALAEDAIVVVTGRLDRRDDLPQLIATEIAVPDLGGPAQGPVAITLPRERCTPPIVDRLKEIFATHPGMCPVHLHLTSERHTLVLSVADRFRVVPSPALMGDLKALLGPGCVR